MDAALEAAYQSMARRIASPAWADDIFTPPPPVGTELDGLALDAEWSPLRRRLFAALGRIEPRQKLCVLSMACNEAAYLPEWIAHHLAIGVEKIYIYTNDNNDGTDEMLRWFAHHTPVVPIPVKSGPGVNIQQKNYRHALALLPELRLFEWVAVLDVDEFLLPAARYKHDMRNFLAAAPADSEAFMFPWHWRQWPRVFEREPGLLAERFPYAVGNKLSKCMTRLRHVTSLANVHFPEFDVPCALRDSEFALIQPDDRWNITTGAGGWVEHFWGKSFEEYLVKMRRGEAMAVDGKPFHRRYDEFFTWTGPLQPKFLHPWPAAMLAATKAQLARFAAMPGFARMQEQTQARYAAYANSVRGDEALRSLFAEMTARYVS